MCLVVGPSEAYEAWRLLNISVSGFSTLVIAWRLVVVGRYKTSQKNAHTKILIDKQMQVLIILFIASVLTNVSSVDSCGFEGLFSDVTRQCLSVVQAFFTSTILWLVLRLFAEIVAKFHRGTRKLVGVMDIYTVVMLIFGFCALGFTLSSSSSALFVEFAVVILELIFMLVIIIGISFYAVKVLIPQFPESSSGRTDANMLARQQLRTVIRFYQFFLLFALADLVFYFGANTKLTVIVQAFTWVLSAYLEGFIVLYLVGRVKKGSSDSSIQTKRVFYTRPGGPPIQIRIVIEKESQNSRSPVRVFVPDQLPIDTVGGPNKSKSSGRVSFGSGVGTTISHLISPVNSKVSSKTVSPVSGQL